MHLLYLVKLDGTTPCVFLFDIFVFLCFRLIPVDDILMFLLRVTVYNVQ